MSESRRPSPPGGSTEFYVGYLPMPPAHLLFLRFIVPALLVLGVGLAALAARSQFDPGGGIWDDATQRTFEGVIWARPYPMLRVTGLAPNEAETLLLVEVGKLGGGQRAAPFDGMTVRVSGWLLERDGRRMIELVPGSEAIAVLPSSGGTPAPIRPPPEFAGEFECAGEIVDSKCYLGAMKPGQGKTHKECATLCVRGGIPPVLIAAVDGGGAEHFVLVDETGGAATELVLPYVGEPVTVRGRLLRLGDMRLLAVASGGVTRRR